MLKHKLVDFIIQFMEEVDKEISEMKLFVSLVTHFSLTSELVPDYVENADDVTSSMRGQDLLQNHF